MASPIQPGRGGADAGTFVTPAATAADRIRVLRVEPAQPGGGMHRRTFLTSALAAGAAALGADAAAQGRATQGRPAGDIPAAAVAAGQGPAPVPPEKLRRIGIM